MRVVLDTNIFISATLGGRLGVIIDEWKAGKFKLIITDSIAHEYLDVINRPKFKIPKNEIIAATDYLLQIAEFVTPGEEVLVIVADPTDNKFLEAALAGKVNYVVSGDNHLLEIGSFRAIPIITAHEFIGLLKTA
jgi:putative PIN family toxin of toxin-antitoxin system